MNTFELKTNPIEEESQRKLIEYWYNNHTNQNLYISKLTLDEFKKLIQK